MLGHKSRPAVFIIVLLVGAALIVAISNGKPHPKQPAPLAAPLPLVEVIEVVQGRQPLWIDSQGVVEPALQTSLVAQVSGRVEQVSPEFANGGHFAAGDTLVKIEAADYEIALSQARASLADAERALAVEKGSAKQAKREWRDLGSVEANDLFLRKPQLASAKAMVEAARAGLRKARLDLQRTEISAPFNGVVLEKSIDVGRFVTAGTKLGEVFATDRAEVRLPVTTRERARLGNVIGRQVVLFNSDIGQHIEWRGEILRVEAAIDTASRQHYLVASVDNPFDASVAVPLTVGQFVQAHIAGPEVEDALLVPRNALRQPSQIWLLDIEDRLTIVDVEVLRRDSNAALVRLPDPAQYQSRPIRVVTSSLSMAVTGLQTEVTGEAHVEMQFSQPDEQTKKGR